LSYDLDTFKVIDKLSLHNRPLTKKWSSSSRIGSQTIIEQLTTYGNGCNAAIFGKPDLYF
ncbi:MAG: hypothetical protein M3Y53_05490, partial [Thermoproteota archaeon]|nr:hypothetical protein [Thermoproteota archaeon]